MSGLARIEPGVSENAPLATLRGNVTGVRLRVVPESCDGPCPGPVKLVANITTDGPATVWYKFLAGPVRKSGPGEGTVLFSRAGTQQVTLDAEYVANQSVAECILLAAPVISEGCHRLQAVSSEPVPFNATCKGQAPANRE